MVVSIFYYKIRFQDEQPNVQSAEFHIFLPFTTASGISFVALNTASGLNFSVSTASLERYSSMPT